MNDTAANILKTLGYFDLFQYPLTVEELYRFHPGNCSRELLQSTLNQLCSGQHIFKAGDFFSLHDNPALAERRIKGNQLAAIQLKKAKRIARFLAGFPSVKSIAVSGSLSKNFASDKTDIDFFIITQTNRLWIARSCMHFFKKLTYLAGKQDLFCMNYYIDEGALTVAEQNIFTAMEVITLKPMQGAASFSGFIKSNGWTKKYFPLHEGIDEAAIPVIHRNYFSRLLEIIFNGSLGERMDKLLMNITKKRWQKKSARMEMSSSGVRLGMMVGRHYSKPDPCNFQAKVIERYETKISQLLQLPLTGYFARTAFS